MPFHLGDLLQIPPQNAPGSHWQGAPIIPDSQLPEALKRVKTLGRPLFYPNEYDQAILDEAAVWKYVAEKGGLDVTSRITELGTPIYDRDPRLEMPTGATILQKIFTKTPVKIGFTGVDFELGNFQVDLGFDGVINRFVTSFSGSGFDDFSGNLIWRLKIGYRYARDLGNVQNQMGDFKSPMNLTGSYIPLVSGQTVSLIANIPLGSPINGGFVTGAVFGWQYPRRG